MFIDVNTDPRNEWKTISVNVDNINYVESLYLNVFYDFKSKIVFNDGTELFTTMEKYKILDLINKK